MSTLTLHLPDAAVTEACGACIAPRLEGGMIVTLAGDLGAGKTTLVRGLLRARGVEGLIKSPTYTLVEHYPVSSLYFYHFDFYRFMSPDDWDTAGFADYFRDDSVCIVEWPERAGDRLPQADLALSLAYDASERGRDLVARGNSASGDRCLIALADFAPTRN
ncbi:MAG TPA: tRNA (adenosine(37)-N6)-threonylcarbamoyltransferase complex ATPase subunit type 1 TsaE [Casimicrobiaceae bacterium]|nr:tRNA (adenosine(37)-N6)-threonylcarbamoyltransferase complex ATPase subunit type 1 TsaE [Casimicrobiaceae bacterium]